MFIGFEKKDNIVWHSDVYFTIIEQKLEENYEFENQLSEEDK